jgi:hypothetical protein
MTDLEKFIDTYKQFGIDVKLNEGENSIVVFLRSPFADDIEATDNEKFDGYGLFFSDVEFSKEGKFLRQGFWE